MNTARKIISILVFAYVGNIHAEELKIQEPTEVDRVSLDFSNYLDGEARWKLREDRILSLKMDGNSTVFMLGDKKEMFRLKSPEYVSKVIISEDRKLVVFAIQEVRWSGSNYATLVMAHSTESGVKFKRTLTSTGRGVRVRRALSPVGGGAKEVLAPEKKFFGGRQWWISELGAVSNDGTRVLAKFGVLSPPKNNSSKVVYSWYTLDVATGEILGVGPAIENGNTPVR